MKLAAWPVLVLSGSLACGGGQSPPSSPTPVQLQVGGAYQILKTTLENACDGILTPGTVTGTVSHTAAAQTFTLNDSFTSFSGTVQSNGAFAIVATPTAPGHTGAPMTTVFDGGRFTTTGFEVQVRLEINGPLAPEPFPACRVTQVWRGTKQGAPNVIPG